MADEIANHKNEFPNVCVDFVARNLENRTLISTRKKCTEQDVYDAILEIFNCDVLNEDESIYPRQICHTCSVKINQSRNFEYKPMLSADFTEHINNGSCKL